jgi:hypothetical protein
MSMALQSVLVALAVLAAAGYAFWTLCPSRLRFAALRRLDAALARGALGDSVLRRRFVTPLRERAARAGGCDSCGGADGGGARPGTSGIGGSHARTTPRDR